MGYNTAMITCCIVVYGCAKNQVDAEEMAGRLKEAGFALSGDPSLADVVIVHTCGFILDAKRESVEGILDACSLKSGRDGTAPVVIATGCLTQRYAYEIMQEIPELDGLAGTNAPRDIVAIVEETLHKGKAVSVGEPGRGAPGEAKYRMFEASRPWAYLRVSEGCRHRCTYCAIPSMRGKLASRPVDDVVSEAKMLLQAGVKEINLIAQDLSDYGVDFDGHSHLAELVTYLRELKGLLWLRLLYVRPDGVTPELAKAMNHPRVAPYVDLPIEHGSDRVLRRMARPRTYEIERACELLRSEVPHIAIRTTIIAGFPGEEPSDLDETLRFLDRIRPHRVAAFAYSPEENTPAERLKNLLPEEERERRKEVVRQFGLELAKRHSETFLGKTVTFLVEKPSLRPGYVLGRGPHQAPEVDGKVFIKAQAATGQELKATVTRTGVTDLWARA